MVEGFDDSSDSRLQRMVKTQYPNLNFPPLNMAYKPKFTYNRSAHFLWNEIPFYHIFLL